MYPNGQATSSCLSHLFHNFTAVKKMQCHNTYCNRVLANVRHVRVFFNISMRRQSGVNHEEHKYEKNESCANHMYVLHILQTVYQQLSKNFVMNTNENRYLKIVSTRTLSITQEFHDQMFSTCACLLTFSCKCNHAWFNTIKYKSNRLHRPNFLKTDHARKRSSNHAKITFRSHIDCSTVLLLAAVKQLLKT